MRSELKVNGMTCEGCAKAVTRAVARVAPAARVSVDLAAGKVTIEGAPEAAAVSAIRAAGYEVPDAA